ncbi:YDG/SRA domain-containing protein [Streptomyces sp. NPDC091267]|uniref:YDG/SRA domain-containing protein n=1 Tax=Streptomyces sp. NPDC091267 TaxID=3155195 RepID=UPI003446D58E
MSSIASMTPYRALFGHVDEIPVGSCFDTRKDVKRAKLHKEAEAGISWGLDSEGQRAADAIVLNNGYEDDVDEWREVVYTGAGGRDRNTGRQVEDQGWDNRGNAGLRRSRIQQNPIRVIRGSQGEEAYSPTSGYRYDGLYGVVEDWVEQGRAGFQICRFRLHRLEDRRQGLTALERQVLELLDHPGNGVIDDSNDDNDPDVRRRKSTIERIVRDTAVVQRVKRWHDYVCQVCGQSLRIGQGRNYAEGAHIHALGGSGGGPDVEGNVLCLCPNCHVRLDRGALYLTDDLSVVDRYAEGGAPRVTPLRVVDRHRIRERFVRAHRRFWNL